MKIAALISSPVPSNLLSSSGLLTVLNRSFAFRGAGFISAAMMLLVFAMLSIVISTKDSMNAKNTRLLRPLCLLTVHNLLLIDFAPFSIQRNLMRFEYLWTRNCYRTLPDVRCDAQLISDRIVVWRMCECEYYSTECIDIYYENGELERYDGKNFTGFSHLWAASCVGNVNCSYSSYSDCLSIVFLSFTLLFVERVCVCERKHNTKANCDGCDRDTRRVEIVKHFRGFGI